jgi:hypothetical protein
MTSPEFGRLGQVCLLDAWSHEAESFTPWLASNIDRLGEALGIPLEQEGREVQVRPPRSAAAPVPVDRHRVAAHPGVGQRPRRGPGDDP